MKWYLIACILGGLGLQTASAQLDWHRKMQLGRYGPGADDYVGALHGIAVSTNGYIAVVEGTNGPIRERVKVFTREGAFVRDWHLPAGRNPGYCAFGSGGLLHVSMIDHPSHGVNVLRISDGASVRTYGLSDTIYLGIAIDSNNDAYVFNSDTDKIEVYNENGVLIRTIGEPGSGVGQLNNVTMICFGSDGHVHTHDSINDRYQIFTKAGLFVRSYDIDATRGAGLSPDGYIFGSGYNGVTRIYDVNTGDYAYDVRLVGEGSLSSMTVDYRGDVWLAHHAGVYHYERTFRTVGGSSNNAIPSGYVKNTTVRPGTGLMDIDYHVDDVDSDSVTVAFLACVNGGDSFADILPMRTFVEGTGDKVGAGIQTRTDHRVTWNLAEDWSVEFGELEIECLVKDDRDLLDLHFITIPANNGAPELTMNRVPLVHEDVLSVWRWLIAIEHPEVKLESGLVKSSQAPFIAYATSTTTTAAGFTWLLNHLGFREATSPEITRALQAREGNEPAITIQNEPLVDTAGSQKPAKVNTYGFDTESTGFWVVPLP